MSQQNTVRPAVASFADRPSAQALIIGGGINGISAFRDLALQGIDVALVERDDFAAGASAASSHMVHGGVRYLENGEFRLVRESVVERNRLIRLAPHYVKPLPTTIPIFKTFSGILNAPLRMLTHRPRKVHERGAVIIKFGLMIYDTFSRDGGRLPRHKFLGKRRSLSMLPKINPDLRYTATYYDASMHDPERLALDVLVDGLEVGSNARAVNYVEAIAFNDDRVVLRDNITGATFNFEAKVVINASGPWTDLTNIALGQPTQFMGGTKGSHIVLDNPELEEATAGHEIFFEHDDGRIVLVYPHTGRVLVGTTDINHDMSKPIRCTEEEVDYFVNLIRHVFPTIHVDRTQIVFRFAGVRPLPRKDDLMPGLISRDYRIEHSELGSTKVLTLVGGKWTTFRALGAHLCDDSLSILGERRKVDTESLPIGGGRGFPTDQTERDAWTAAHPQVSSHRASELLDRYGTRAHRIIESLRGAPEQMLQSAPSFSRQELTYVVEHEFVERVADILLRRTLLAFRGSVTPALLAEVADIIGDVRGWDPDQRQEEVRRAADYLNDRHGLALAYAS